MRFALIFAASFLPSFAVSYVATRLAVNYFWKRATL